MRSRSSIIRQRASQARYTSAFNIIKMWIKIEPLLLFSLLPRLVLSDFLHTGCTVQSTITSSTFEDSLEFHIYLPSKFPKLTVKVTQGNKITSLTVDDTMQSYFKHQWEKLRLEMRGRLRLVFGNGTVWQESNTIMSQEPMKLVSVRRANLLKDCPQGLPNWCLQNGGMDLTQDLRRGGRETFRLLLTGPASPSFTVGQTTMVLCWDRQSKKSLLLLAVTCSNGLQPVPAFQWIRLQFVHNEMSSTLEIHCEDKVQLINFYPRDNTQDIIFHNKGLTQNLYVVHHLENYSTHTSANSCQIDICLWVAVPVIVVLSLVVLVTIYLSVYFHERWSSNSKVLTLLKGDPPEEPPPMFDNDDYLVVTHANKESCHIYECLDEVRYTTTPGTTLQDEVQPEKNLKD